MKYSDPFKMNIAVVGSGYWGKNLVRNFHQLECPACGMEYTDIDSGLQVRAGLLRI